SAPRRSRKPQGFRPRWRARSSPAAHPAPTCGSSCEERAVTDGLEYLGRARVQGLLLLLVVLLVGVLAGAAGDRLLSGGDGPRRFGPPQRHGPPGPGRGPPDGRERREVGAAGREVIGSLPLV